MHIRFPFRTEFLLKVLDATIGRFLCRLIGWWDYLHAGDEPGATAPAVPLMAAGHRLLVIRPGGLGDMILLLPALKALRDAFPSGRIDMLCEGRNAAILPLAGFSGDVLRYDRPSLHLWRQLRRRRYGIVIDTEQFHHLSAVVARLTGAAHRIGFNINPVRNLLYTHLVNYAVDAPETVQFMRLLEPLGLSDQPPSADGILHDAAESVMPPAAAALPAVPAGTLAPLVAVYVAASTPYKQWPIDRFQAVITTLLDELGLDVILVGGKEAMAASRRLADAFAGRAGGVSHVRSVAGITTLPETAAILRRARFFLGTDCGLTHLALAVGTPTVTLFGPSDPQKWGHPGPRHQVLQCKLSCSPCFIFGYHRLCRHRNCMSAISVAAVTDACSTLGPVRDKPPG